MNFDYTNVWVELPIVKSEWEDTTPFNTMINVNDIKLIAWSRRNRKNETFLELKVDSVWLGNSMYVALPYEEVKKKIGLIMG